MNIEGRLNKGPRLRRQHRDGKEAKQDKRNTRERRRDIICKPNARRIQVRATCGKSTRASEPARARLGWVILFLVLPVTFGHTTACRSPAALVFSATIHFAMKYSAPCSGVLRHSPSSWAVVYIRSFSSLCSNSFSRSKPLFAPCELFYAALGGEVEQATS